MNSKKCRTFLYISLSFFLLTVIGVVVITIWDYYQDQVTFANDPRKLSDEMAWMMFCLTILLVPVLMVELSGIRSAYKLLKYKPEGVTKICYLISTIISFSAFIWQVLALLGVTSLFIPNWGIKMQDLILILPGLPTLLVSFILGSIPIKRKI